MYTRRIAHSAPPLRVNPGGKLFPSQVVGRDPLIAGIWGSLEQQSVLLTAERRMGKTSVLNKMLAEPRSGAVTIKRSLQGTTSSDEFVRNLIVDVAASLPGILKTSLVDRLRKAGVKTIGVSAAQVEFEPSTDGSWKDVIGEVFTHLDDEVDSTVVLLWDELPHMVSSIHESEGPIAARELLDVLRAARETHTTVRMVLSGSLGLHHVVNKLRDHGGMWAPTHDMLTIDVPPLSPDDASYLAVELLRNETVECDDIDVVGAAIAQSVDCVPYYVHHTIHRLLTDQQQGRCGQVNTSVVEAVVDQALRDPLDPWQLQHYVVRVGSYYGDDADTVTAIVDLVATATEPPDAEVVHERIGALIERPPSLEQTRNLLALLCKDHYLGVDSEGRYTFRLDLVRRAWLGRRPRKR